MIIKTQAELVASEVMAIRASQETATRLAPQFNVSISNIKLIQQRKTWTHV
jgi:hypothetical protein